MKFGQFRNQLFLFSLLAVLAMGCNSKSGETKGIETDTNGVAILSEEQTGNLVKRSY